MFAESKADPTVGYALSPQEVWQRISPAIGRTAAVATGPALCVVTVHSRRCGNWMFGRLRAMDDDPSVLPSAVLETVRSPVRPTPAG